MRTKGNFSASAKPQDRALVQQLGVNVDVTV